MQNTYIKPVVIFAVLAILMAATRSHHFGSMLSLPDASWPIFLLAGFYLPRWVFPVLLVEAGLVDYWAISYGGVSDWCFSAAYWFLIPTYFSLWFGGRYYVTRHQFSWRSLAELAGIASIATSVAFVISNASFYLFADYFGELSAAQYGAQVAQYFLPYLQTMMMYLAVAALLHIAVLQITKRSVVA